jgi:uncharacterized membrane protein YraQ (UPF0718 family)
VSRLKDAVLLLIFVVLGLGLVFLLQNFLAGNIRIAVADQVEIFTTIFLGIFIEAAPFLLLGTLASGFVEVYLKKDDFARLVPRSPILGPVFGGFLGFFFPVCECGVVPFTRRLFNKGLPPPVGIAFLLAAPVLNPIAIASTYAAYGFGPVLVLRVGLSFIIAVFIGMVFAKQKRPARMLNAFAMPVIQGGSGGEEATPANEGGWKRQLPRVFSIAGGEFFEMGRYLIIGAMLAALMQTVIPQPALLSLGTGPASSILVMMTLAFVLSVCSTVDAFISLAFVGTFSTGSILAFLIFGPMIDIKNTLMYMQVFRRRTVLYLVLLPFLLTFLATLYINLFTGL